MNRLQTIILSTFLALAWTVCVAEIPKGRIFRSEFTAEEASRMEIGDMIWPEDCLIAPKLDRYPEDIMALDTEVRKRVSRYKEFVNANSDTLFLICGGY